jgi:uroporphyrinogen-III synthase
MKILFTKTVIEKEASKHLGTDFTYDFKDFIKIENVETKPFSLQNQFLIFSSANAVKAFFENGFQPNADLNKIYVVGKKTEETLVEFGYNSNKIFKNINELSQFIVNENIKEDFLHFCGNLTLDVLENTLAEHQVSYPKITVYNTQLLYSEISENYDAVVFFSPSGVRSFAKFNSLSGKALFAIGQTTEKELRKYTQNAIFTSQENNLEDLLHLIKQKVKL